MPDPRNTATGYLVVAVSTARNALPLENALVTVSAVDNNGVAELLFTKEQPATPTAFSV